MTRLNLSGRAEAALSRSLRLGRRARARSPRRTIPAPFRPVMLSHAIEETDFAPSIRRIFHAEWKWDGIRVQAVGGKSRPMARRVTRLYSRTGEDISDGFPDLVDALDFEGAIDGELLILREGARPDPSTCCSSGSTARR